MGSTAEDLDQIVGPRETHRPTQKVNEERDKNKVILLLLLLTTVSIRRSVKMESGLLKTQPHSAFQAEKEVNKTNNFIEKTQRLPPTDRGKKFQANVIAF